MLENEIPWNSQRGMRRIMDDTVESLIETECCLFIIYDEQPLLCVTVIQLVRGN